MNITEIEQLVQLVSGVDIGELTLQHEGARITIRKPSRPAPATHNAMSLYSEHGEDQDDFELDLTDEGDSAGVQPEDDVVTVKSPRVGAFRHAKNPVVLGATVRDGQVLGSIEAMKLHSDVPAPQGGKVVEVFVEDGQFVEYGQDLYAIQGVRE